MYNIYLYTYKYTYAINNSSTSDQLTMVSPRSPRSPWLTILQNAGFGLYRVHGPVLQHPSSTVTVISTMTTTYAHMRIFIDAHGHMASGQLTAQCCFRIHSHVLQTTLRVP